MDTSFSLAVTGQGVLQVGRGMAAAHKAAAVRQQLILVPS